MANNSTAFLKAQRHLRRSDPVLKKLIAEIGPCTLRPDPNRFGLLVRSIISQQISTKAAISIGARLMQALGRRGLTPRSVLALSAAKLRSVGLSTNKTRFVRDLAQKVHTKEVPLDDLHEKTDEEVIAHLLPVLGIGRWTAEMFLIFSLGRLDVLPVGDFGLQVGVKRHYGFTEPLKNDQIQKLAEPWQPYRTIATWYIWRSLGGVPQSD
jgi:DNA-3-methyladenine glycosylase II